ncbi:unnamed protein product [marine sediment metagenome]|uniref:Uncharacterized protein n=1 Tax=marine sediment metagenome TaxID=412755 RepID=X1ASC1_9ZZZZ
MNHGNESQFAHVPECPMAAMSIKSKFIMAIKLDAYGKLENI